VTRTTSRMTRAFGRSTAAICAAAALAVTGIGARAQQAEFSAVQVTLFAQPGALSNAWADYDNDGDADLVVTFKNGEVRLYRNDGRTFTSVGAALGLPVSGDDARGASWGDYDGDGYVDLYIGSFQRPIPGVNKLYKNADGKKFIEVAKQAGVDMPGASSRQASWIDYDNDGDLDLFVAERSGLNRLFRNGGGTFVEVTQASGMFDPRRSVGACWFDYDKDGDIDVFIANQAGDRDAFYRNDNGKFTDVAMELNMDKPRRPVTEGSVGCAVGDYDNDGNFDLFVTAYGEDMLYRSDGAGQFTDVAKTVGITGHHHHDSAVWGDFNNDGRLDLYVVSFRADNPSEQDYLYVNTGGRFIDVLPENIAAHNGDHGAQWADYDRDGDLDRTATIAPAANRCIATIPGGTGSRWRCWCSISAAALPAPARKCGCTTPTTSCWERAWSTAAAATTHRTHCRCISVWRGASGSRWR
jgi:hypothetical protein